MTSNDARSPEKNESLLVQQRAGHFDRRVSSSIPASSSSVWHTGDGVSMCSISVDAVLTHRCSSMPGSGRVNVLWTEVGEWTGSICTARTGLAADAMVMADEKREYSSSGPSI